jgi:hypothetical protein
MGDSDRKDKSLTKNLHSMPCDQARVRPRRR